MKFDDDHSSRGLELILIAEGHDALQSSLKDLVMTELSDVRVLTVHSGKEAVRISLTGMLSAAIIDIDLPDLNGLEATRQIHAVLPDTPIVLINIEDGPEYITAAISAGARACVARQKIVTELSAVLKGLLWAEGSTDPRRDCGAD